MRQWTMYAQRQTSPIEGREFCHFGAEPWVRMCFGGAVVQVQLSEDPDGGYWGWIEAGGTTPEMIQPHHGMFTMQFPYGPEAEQERGRGEIVRMTAREV